VKLDRPTGGLELTEVTNPDVLASLARVDGMSDEELRELVLGEHPSVVAAAEGLIAGRLSAERRPS
jgi:hypothetical protein